MKTSDITKKVLAIDDTNSTLIMLSELFKNEYHVLPVKSGEKGLQALEKNRDIDIIIVDYYMPEMDGIEFTKKLRENNKFIPIIMLTGNDTLGTLRGFLRAGGNDFCSKESIEFLPVIIEKELENAKKNIIAHQQEQYAQMGEMLNMIAHQWRQPLATINAIIGNMQIQLELHPPKTVEEITVKIQEYKITLNKVTQTNLGLSNMISDFNAFLKPSKEKTNISLNDITEKTINSIKEAMKDIHISIDCKKPVMITTYKTPIMQALLVILNNAREALEGRENPKVIIRIQEKPIRISIQDNGPGINKNVLKKLGEPNLTTKPNGTGIGLHTVMNMLKACNAQLTAQNNYKGALFQIEFSEKE